MKALREIQAALGVTIDGIPGPETEAAIRAFQAANKLPVDGIAGPLTQAVMFPPKVGVAPAGLFDASSHLAVVQAHPLLQSVLYAARAKIEFRVLDSRRGKRAQEEAFAKGNSKAHFGQSAHNYSPAVAVDLFPAPYKWADVKSFRKLYDVIGRYDPKTGKGKGIALEKRVPIRCGIDWNMDDDKTTSDAWDGGHYELHKWQDYATTLYNG